MVMVSAWLTRRDLANAANCTAQLQPIASSTRMEVEAMFFYGRRGSPLPVALVEGRRWAQPGTPNTLGARKAKVFHQVNQVVAQSKILRYPVDRFYARHFDLRRSRCRSVSRPHRRRVLRMCCKRPSRSHSSKQADELVAPHSTPPCRPGSLPYPRRRSESPTRRMPQKDRERNARTSEETSRAASCYGHKLDSGIVGRFTVGRSH